MLLEFDTHVVTGTHSQEDIDSWRIDPEGLTP